MEAMKSIPISWIKAFCKDATTRTETPKKTVLAKKATHEAGDHFDPEGTAAAMPLNLEDGIGDTDDEDTPQGKSDTPSSDGEEEEASEGDDGGEEGEVSELTPKQAEASARRTSEAQAVEAAAFFGAQRKKKPPRTKRWCALTRTLTYSPIDCHKVPTSPV
jgi:hypothetical protein